MGGLFLKFTDPEAAIASLANRQNAAVEILFTSDLIEAAQIFRVPATLRRISQFGVGVAFDRHPADALRVLQMLRMASHRHNLADLPAFEASLQLREVSSTLLNETLLLVHDQTMHLLGDRLSAAAAQAPDMVEHSALMSAVLEFGKRAASIQTRFVQLVLDTAKQVCPIQTYAARDSADGKLSLIEEQDFEDWLATATEVHKLDEMYRAQLFYLEPRVGQLFDFDCDHSNNPFGPDVIGHAYRSALQDVPVSARARQVAYATLRDALSDQLAPLYAELLALLPASPIEAERKETSAEKLTHRA
ncbi:MAG: DUF1631 family protein, partial [Thiobacillus sp.]